MATIRIKLFAHIREQVGESEFVVELDTPATVNEVLDKVADKSENFRAYYNASPILAAVNQTMVEHDHQVNLNDELALFPPVTGG